MHCLVSDSKWGNTSAIPGLPDVPASPRHLARRNATQALYQWLVTGQAPGDIESKFISDETFASVDLDYFRHLIMQVPRYQDELERRLEAFSERASKKLDPVERAIVLVGAYEILFRPDVPKKVAINEAVQVAHVFGAEQGYRFVNSVLHQLAKSAESNDDDEPPG